VDGARVRREYQGDRDEDAGAGGVSGAGREGSVTIADMEPIAGTLTNAEMRDRRATLMNPVRRAVIDITPLPVGYLYRFEATSEILAQLARLVDR
jgi:hypothetical protein